MEEGEFFVMLNHPSERYVPMVWAENEIAKFNTQEDAEEAARDSSLGTHFGYEIFQIGKGL